jgi:transposase-like protein
LNPKPRHLDEEKATLIRNALRTKTPISAICRMFKVSPKTVYALMKGSRVALFLLFGVEDSFWKRDTFTPEPQEKIAVRMEPAKTLKWASLSSNRSICKAHSRFFGPIYLLLGAAFV